MNPTTGASNIPWLVLIAFLAGCGSAVDETDPEPSPEPEVFTVELTDDLCRPDLYADDLEIFARNGSVEQETPPRFGTVNQATVDRMIADPWRGPMYMINYIHHYDQAQYPDDYDGPEGTNVSGREVDSRYNPSQYMEIIGARLAYARIRRDGRPQGFRRGDVGHGGRMARRVSPSGRLRDRAADYGIYDTVQLDILGTNLDDETPEAWDAVRFRYAPSAEALARFEADPVVTQTRVEHFDPIVEATWSVLVTPHTYELPGAPPLPVTDGGLVECTDDATCIAAGFETCLDLGAVAFCSTLECTSSDDCTGGQSCCSCPAEEGLPDALQERTPASPSPFARASPPCAPATDAHLRRGCGTRPHVYVFTSTPGGVPCSSPSFTPCPSTATMPFCTC